MTLSTLLGCIVSSEFSGVRARTLYGMFGQDAIEGIRHLEQLNLVILSEGEYDNPRVRAANLGTLWNVRRRAA